jgi:hypothetical protein
MISQTCSFILNCLEAKTSTTMQRVKTGITSWQDSKVFSWKRQIFQISFALQTLSLTLEHKSAQTMHSLTESRLHIYPYKILGWLLRQLSFHGQGWQRLLRRFKNLNLCCQHDLQEYSILPIFRWAMIGQLTNSLKTDSSKNKVSVIEQLSTLTVLTNLSTMKSPFPCFPSQSGMRSTTHSTRSWRLAWVTPPHLVGTYHDLEADALGSLINRLGLQLQSTPVQP